MQFDGTCLQVAAALSDHPLISVSKQFLRRELESRQLKAGSDRRAEISSTGKSLFSELL